MGQIVCCRNWKQDSEKMDAGRNALEGTEVIDEASVGVTLNGLDQYEIQEVLKKVDSDDHVETLLNKNGSFCIRGKWLNVEERILKLREFVQRKSSNQFTDDSHTEVNLEDTRDGIQKSLGPHVSCDSPDPATRILRNAQTQTSSRQSSENNTAEISDENAEYSNAKPTGSHFIVETNTSLESTAQIKGSAGNLNDQEDIVTVMFNQKFFVDEELEKLQRNKNLKTASTNGSFQVEGQFECVASAFEQLKELVERRHAQSKRENGNVEPVGSSSNVHRGVTPIEAKHPSQVSKPKARVLVRDLTNTGTGNPQLDHTHSQSLAIEEHIWHYLLFKHADDVAKISSTHKCQTSVVSKYAREGITYSLEVSPYNNLAPSKGAQDAAEEFAALYQKVSEPGIVKEPVEVPVEMNEKELEELESKLRTLSFVLIPVKFHHLIGPRSKLEQAKEKVWLSVDKFNRKMSAADEEKGPSYPNGTDTSQGHLQQSSGPLQFRTAGGLTVNVSQGNLIHQKTEAIVNPANSYLAHGSGAARAIADAAGKGFLVECKDHIERFGQVKTTEVTHTSAGKLSPKIKFVIHAVGPRSSDDKNPSVTYDKVKRTVCNCLHYANSILKIRSITIPAISSGIFGVPVEHVAKASFEALMDFDKMTSEKSLHEIYFTNIDQQTVSVMRKTFEQMLLQIGGSSVDPYPWQDKLKMIDNYADALNFWRVDLNIKSHKNCFARAVAKSLKSQLDRDIAWKDVDARVHAELQKHSGYYKGFNSTDLKETTENTSWIDTVMSLFTSESRNPVDITVHITAAANALDVKIILVQLQEDGPPTERVFEPWQESGSSHAVPSVHLAHYYNEHHHFDALMRKHEGQHKEMSSDHSKGKVTSTKTENSGPGSLSVYSATQSKTSKSTEDFEKIDHSEANDMEKCIICMDDIYNKKELPCKHAFCQDCIDTYFVKCQPKCPSCGKVFGVLKGDQPDGTMRSNATSWKHLDGYPGCGTIEIQYSFNNGIQGDNHPNPGQPYRGTHRTAFLPANKEGKEVLALLRRAFDAGLVFTIGRSNTTGHDNVVIWNDVHHKTSPTGQYGYPDPTYLNRVREELAAKGIQ